VSTAGYVKLLLPPRQSRGNSYWGLGLMTHYPSDRSVERPSCFAIEDVRHE
jgi:hypothetical protein